MIFADNRTMVDLGLAIKINNTNQDFFAIKINLTRERCKVDKNKKTEK